MITPTTPATFYGFNDQIVSVPLITLAAWVVGLKSVVEHDFDPTPGQNLKAIIYEALECPADYPVEYALQHLIESKRQTDEYYGVGQ